MARARTMGPEAPKAWTKRAAVSMPMLEAKVQATLARRKRPSPARSTGRRPVVSEIGPYTSWPTAKPMRKADRVSWVCAVVAFSSREIAGSEGRYMSVDRGPSAPRSASMTVIAKVSRPRRIEDQEQRRAACLG